MVLTTIDPFTQQRHCLLGFATGPTAVGLYRIIDPEAVRAWLKDLPLTDARPRDTPTQKTNHPQKDRERRLEMNVALTSIGLQQLGWAWPRPGANPEAMQERNLAPNEPYPFALGTAFFEGAAVRGQGLGETSVGWWDDDPHHPAEWDFGWDEKRPHLALIAAADEVEELKAALQAPTAHGLMQVGETIGEAGRAHGPFGYHDPISQPAPEALLGDLNLTARAAPRDHRPLGDILVGGDYPRSVPSMLEPAPTWAAGGSFLVLRNYRMDVPMFECWVKETAAQIGESTEKVKALVVGRWPAGSPLVRFAEAPPEAPGQYGAEHGVDLDNDFDFGGQRSKNRKVCPFTAHIRRAHPRDDRPRRDSPRVLRRSFVLDPKVGSKEVGLCFLCYQASIDHGFETILSHWMMSEVEGEPKNERDALLSWDPKKPRTIDLGFDAAGKRRTTRLGPELRWIMPRAGAYLFLPTLPAVRAMAAGPNKV